MGVEQDVGRLDVAVNDALIVSRLQARAELHAEVQHGLDREPPAAGELRE